MMLQGPLARTFDKGSSISDANLAASDDTEISEVALRVLDPEELIDPNQGIGPIPQEIQDAALSGRISPGTLDTLVRMNEESFRQYIQNLNQQP